MKKKLKKPNIRIVDHKDGGMSFYAEGGDVNDPPQLYPAPSLAFQQATQQFVKSQDARKKAEEVAKAEATKQANSPERFKQKPTLKTGKTTASDNARVVDQQIVTPYTNEELEEFKRTGTPKELYAWKKQQLDTWKQGDIQEEKDITQRRIDVAKQAELDISKGLFTQAVAEDISNGYRFSNKDNFIDDWINPFQWVLNPAGNLAGNFAVDAGPINPYKVAMDAGLLALGTSGVGDFVAPFAKNLARNSGRYLTKQTPLRNAYNYNPWATKIEDAASKTVGKGNKAFIFDRNRGSGPRTFNAEPHFIKGYKPIKDKSNLDFSPLNNKYTEEAKQEILKNFYQLTGGNADNIDLKQFVDFYNAQVNRNHAMYKHQDNLYQTAVEQYLGTPKWEKAYKSTKEEPRKLLRLLESQNVQPDSPLGKWLGQGAEGTVYELATDPKNVIKVGQTIKTHSADDLVKSFEGITSDNIAVVKRAYKDGNKLIEIMPNLNRNGQFNNLTKEQVLDKLEADVRDLMNKGFTLDLDNLSGNFKYNKNKNIVDIYDISKTKEGNLQNQDAVVQILRERFNNEIPDTPLRKLGTTQGNINLMDSNLGTAIRNDAAESLYGKKEAFEKFQRETGKDPGDVVLGVSTTKKQVLKDPEGFTRAIGRGAESLENVVNSRLNDLTSKEGYERLVKQEKQYLESINYSGNRTLEKQAQINAGARINELKDSKLLNSLARDYYKGNYIRGTGLDEIINNKNFYNNAYSESGRIGVDDIGEQIISGEIGIGAPYLNNIPTMHHEIAHALQRGRKMPIDTELSFITPRPDLSKKEADQFLYFFKGSGGLEPSGFANELRASMLERGLINNIYDPITPGLLEKAYNSFKTKPMGIYVNPQTNLPVDFKSTHRILDFMDPNMYNFRTLARTMNKLPSTVPIGIGLGVGAGLSQQQFGGSIELSNRMYEEGGEYELSQEEIQDLKNQGYDIELL